MGGDAAAAPMLGGEHKMLLGSPQVEVGSPKAMVVAGATRVLFRPRTSNSVLTRV